MDLAQGLTFEDFECSASVHEALRIAHSRARVSQAARELRDAEIALRKQKERASNHITKTLAERESQESSHIAGVDDANPI
ncbi:hypothetical protein ADUPG1_005507, partial [Aduncisulcus paluster]